MISATTVEPSLLARYDRPGPRYTSYPTAPNFSTGFDESDFRRFAEVRGHRPLSLYVHVPFCSNPCFFCGCNRVITRSVARGEEYVRRLLQEIERVGPLFRDRRVEQLHFGGGTPNFLAPAQLGRIIEVLRRQFDFAPNCEISVEIDPRVLGNDDVRKLADLGFNRASLGVQDFDPDVQVAVNRLQSMEQTVNAIGDCRRAGIHSINVDLMYGLPRQTREGFHRTLEAVLDMRPSRLAIYGYAHLPQMFKGQRQINSDELPDPNTRVALLGMAIGALTAAGYRYIGMDHFALPEDELALAQDSGTLQRNFMGYTTRGGSDLLGLGVSAISHIGNSFSQNPRDLSEWERALDRGALPVWRGLSMDEDDVIRADVIGRIMCQGDVDIAAIERQYAIDFWTYFAGARPLLEELASDGLVWACSSRIVASPKGRYFLRLIAGCFDRYLPAGGAVSSGGYSKIV
ncbi:MAG: oxygen-independent coproporphyrinogen III oxidase [Proteobacteria bacterium]|nr:oxygen-independent coproporphyrinogen III oxidase [Pseudomonadota bacterium]